MFTTEEQMREEQDFTYATQSDWHSAYHREHGYQGGCPWDCAACDPPYEPEWWEPLFSRDWPIEIKSDGFCEGKPMRYPLAVAIGDSCPCHTPAAPEDDPDCPF